MLDEFCSTPVSGKESDSLLHCLLIGAGCTCTDDYTMLSWHLVVIKLLEDNGCLLTCSQISLGLLHT